MRNYLYKGKIYRSHSKLKLARRLQIYHVGPWRKIIYNTKDIKALKSHKQIWG